MRLFGRHGLFRRGIATVLVICLAVLAGAMLPPRVAAQEAAAPAVAVLADFSDAAELARWERRNYGPQSSVAATEGPGGLRAVQVTAVYEKTLAPQSHSPAPYMILRRTLDPAKLAQGGFTRLTFWHRGDSVQVVFEEKERGDCYYAVTGASPEWRRVTLRFDALRLGWNAGGPGKGEFDLTRMEAVHLAVTPPVGEKRSFAAADLRLERSVEDLDPRTFLGSQRPVSLRLYPDGMRVPVNRTLPILVTVKNEEGSGLAGKTVVLAVQGGDLLASAGGRTASSLRLTTDASGKARALLKPAAQVGKSYALTARIEGGGVPEARATGVTAPALRKVRLAENGFFADPQGRRVMPLGSLFLPWWAPVKDGQAEPGPMAPFSVTGGSPEEQRAWFAYLKRNGVNYVRGYWPWGWSKPLRIGPGGTEVPDRFNEGERLNEPLVAALERTLQIAGEQGIGVSLTIADPARHFLGGYSGVDLPEGKSRRQALREAEEFLRAFVPRLMFNPHVWSYELTNEQGPATFDWSTHFIHTIKDLDPTTPVMVSHGGGGLQTADPLAWMRNTPLDIYQPHLYPDSGHRLFLPTVDAGLLQEVHYNAAAGPKPWLLGEAGGFGTHPPMGIEPDAATQRYLARDCIWLGLLNRANGAGIWGIKHHATTEFRVASEIAPLVDWPLLARGRASVGVAVPRKLDGRYFQTDEGKKALEVMADYARWGLERGVAVDFAPDTAGYPVRASAAEPFRAPAVESPFTIAPGYQMKVRSSSDGKQVVGYLRNLSGIKLHKVEGAPDSRWKVNGAYIRTRAAVPARVGWNLPGQRYTLTVWDLDTGEKREVAADGKGGMWEHGATDHDYLLLWRQR